MDAHPASAVGLCAGQAAAPAAALHPPPEHPLRKAGAPRAAAATGPAGSSDASSNGSLGAACTAGSGSSGRQAVSSGDGAASEHALPATPRLQGDSRPVHSAATVWALSPPSALRTPSAQRLQTLRAGAASEEPCTPCPGRHLFGSPLIAPLTAPAYARVPGSLGGHGLRPAQAGQLRGRWGPLLGRRLACEHLLQILATGLLLPAIPTPQSACCICGLRVHSWRADQTGWD